MTTSPLEKQNADSRTAELEADNKSLQEKQINELKDANVTSSKLAEEKTQSEKRGMCHSFSAIYSYSLGVSRQRNDFMLGLLVLECC